MEGGKRVKENWWFIMNKNSVILTYFIQCIYYLESEYKIEVKRDCRCGCNIFVWNWEYEIQI